MHEIITLQFGKQSNFVGTHFWNAQESYFTYGGEDDSHVNHDVSFRAGIGSDGSDTFLPRAVIYDFKTSFGTLRKINELYEVLGDDQQHSNTWGGIISPQLQPTLPLNDYQRSLNAGLQQAPISAENVRFWSDYSRVYYHPRSIVQVYENEINPERRAFDDWRVGEELFMALDAEHDLLDRDLRPFLEECDQLQGLQVFTSVDTAWSAFSARYVDRIRDELGKPSIWVWAIGEEPATTPSRRRAKRINQARALSELSTQSSVYIPLAGSHGSVPDYITLNTNTPWQTAALQMTALETFTLPSRLLASRGSGAAYLDYLASAISPVGDRQIGDLSFQVFDIDELRSGEDMIASRHSERGSATCNLLPIARDGATNDDIHVFSEVETCRGPLSGDGASANGHGNGSEAGHDFKRFQSELAFPILDSFPQIYSVAPTSVGKVSVRVDVKTSSRIAAWVRSVERNTRQLMGVEEREGFTNELQEIAERYETRLSDETDDWE